jgi:hypothetical protein
VVARLSRFDRLLQARVAFPSILRSQRHVDMCRMLTSRGNTLQRTGWLDPSHRCACNDYGCKKGRGSLHAFVTFGSTRMPWCHILYLPRTEFRAAELLMFWLFGRCLLLDRLGVAKTYSYTKGNIYQRCTYVDFICLWGI